MGLYPPQTFVLKASYDVSPKLDLSIEGMRSQHFSEGVFVFMMIGVIVFSVIIGALMLRREQQKDSKRGETVMFVAIIIGVVIAVIYGALQMLGGYLF